MLCIFLLLIIQDYAKRHFLRFSGLRMICKNVVFFVVSSVKTRLANADMVVDNVVMLQAKTSADQWMRYDENFYGGPQLTEQKSSEISKLKKEFMHKLMGSKDKMV